MREFKNRLDTLLESMIDNRRDKEGKFVLHEGFDKNCGQKGQRLSGG